MTQSDFGRDEPVGPADSGDRDTDIGGSHSGGDGGDAHVIGDGQATRTGGNPLSREEVEGGTPASGGVPEDVAYGTRKTVGQDEEGAGMPDSGGPSGGA
jgi:hypothetical protein